MKLRHEGAPIDLHEMPPSMATGDALRSLIEPHLAQLRPGGHQNSYEYCADC